MNILKANTDQYNELNGYRKGNNVLQFIKDADDNWIVGTEVLTNANFIAIRPQLELLEVIKHNPVIAET